MVRPCRAGHEALGLDGGSPALQAWASDFGKTRSFQKKHLPCQSDGYTVALGSGARSDGPLQTAHPCVDCVCTIIPDGVPALVPSPRRIGGYFQYHVRPQLRGKVSSRWPLRDDQSYFHSFVGQY